MNASDAILILGKDYWQYIHVLRIQLQYWSSAVIICNTFTYYDYNAGYE